jgi:hypothetical protein
VTTPKIICLKCKPAQWQEVPFSAEGKPRLKNALSEEGISRDDVSPSTYQTFALAMRTVPKLHLLSAFIFGDYLHIIKNWRIGFLFTSSWFHRESF